MGIKITGKPSNIPHQLLENIAMMHGALDPDSGHMTCHYKSLGLLVAATDEGPVPFLVIDECILVTLGRGYVEKVLGSAKPVEGPITLSNDGLRVAGANVDARHLLSVMDFAREVNGRMSFYVVEIDDEVNDRRGKAVGVVISYSDGAEPVLVIVTECVDKGKDKYTLSIHY